MKINPTFYDALAYRGKVYLKKKDFHRALDDFDYAIELESENTMNSNKVSANFTPVKHLFNPLICYFSFLKYIIINY